MHRGWIKTFRAMEDWEWYTDANTFRVFMHILITCNHEKKRWRNKEIMPGQLVTSVSVLATQLRLSSKQIRTSLGKLKSTSEMAIKTTNKYTLISVQNWEKYQNGNNESGNQEDNQKAIKGQSKGNQRATTKECKNIRTNITHRPFDNDQPVEISKSSKVTCFSFDEFWDIYDKKLRRKRCEQLFAKIKETDRQIIKDKLPAYIASTPVLKYRRNPANWLNDESWHDEIYPANKRQTTKTATGEPYYGIM